MSRTRISTTVDADLLTASGSAGRGRPTRRSSRRPRALLATSSGRRSTRRTGRRTTASRSTPDAWGDLRPGGGRRCMTSPACGGRRREVPAHRAPPDARRLGRSSGGEVGRERSPQHGDGAVVELPESAAATSPRPARATRDAAERSRALPASDRGLPRRRGSARARARRAPSTSVRRGLGSEPGEDASTVVPAWTEGLDSVAAGLPRRSAWSGSGRSRRLPTLRAARGRP